MKDYIKNNLFEFMMGIAILILSISVLLLSIAYFSSQTDINVMKGDIDGDNQVTITDLVLVNRAALGKYVGAYDYANVDMNSDGVINQLDVEAISDIILWR